MLSLNRFLYVLALSIVLFTFGVSAQDIQHANVGWPFTRSSLTPFRYQDELDFLHLVCEGLFTIDTSSSQGYLPALAVSSEVSDDGLMYTINLREGVNFSNGNPFTANDVIFSLNRSLEDYNIGIDYLEAIDELTVLIHLQYPIPFLEKLISGYFIMSEAAGNANDSIPMCTGSYAISQWNPNESLELVNNPFYDAESDAPYLDSLRLAIIPEFSAQLSMYQAGELDFALIPSSRLSDPQISGIINSGGGRLDITPDFLGSFLAYSLFEPPTNDTRVRQALSLAIDREVLADILFQGFLESPEGFYPSYLRQGFSDIDFEHNPERAAELLAEAGYFGLELDILVSESERSRLVAEIIQAQVAEAGISLNIQSVSSSEWIDRVRACNFQTAFISWSVVYGDLSDAPYNFLRECGYTGTTSFEIFNAANETRDRGLYAEAELFAVTEETVLTPIYESGFGVLFRYDLESSVWWKRFERRRRR